MLNARLMIVRFCSVVVEGSIAADDFRRPGCFVNMRGASARKLLRTMHSVEQPEIFLRLVAPRQRAMNVLDLVVELLVAIKLTYPAGHVARDWNMLYK